VRLPATVCPVNGLRQQAVTYAAACGINAGSLALSIWNPHRVRMDYRVVPRRRQGYAVEAIAPSGRVKVLRVWPTEDEAVTHLRQLRAQAKAREATPQPATKRRFGRPLGRYARPDGFA
jgi:hypothetical protein